MPTIVLIPDTQHLSNSATWIAHFQAAADYIVAQEVAQDIQLVLGLGDVTHNATITEYDRAQTPMETIWNADIPFVAAIGNHDYNGGAPAADHTDTTRWNTYFGQGMYTGRPWWNGAFKDAGKSENLYFTMSLGGRATLVIALEFYPRAATLSWAGGIIAAHPTHDVIIVTHSYLNDNGHLTKADDEHGPDFYSLTDASSGVDMWNEFRQYSNAVAVVNGHHINGSTTAHFPDVGDGGNSVFQQFTNWQQKDQGGDGRIVLLSITGTVATRRVYNPRTATLESQYDLESQFYGVGATGSFGDAFSPAFDIIGVLPDPPAAPTGVSAVAVGSSCINVGWLDVADETGYRVERSPDGVGSWVDVSGNLPADTTSYLDCGLTAATTYFYRVFAFNTGGDSPPSTVESATTATGFSVDNPTPGNFWVHAYEGDYSICAQTVAWSRTRPFGSVQPIEGGPPVTVTGRPGLRDYAFTIAVNSTADMITVENIIAHPLVFVQFAGHHPDQWMAPQADSYQVIKVGRNRLATVQFVGVEPEPVPSPADFL